MAVHYNAIDDTYYERRQIGNQTIELGINFVEQNEHDRKGWWNIYLTVFNKRKDMYSNMDKKIITGKDPIANFLAAREMFYNVEAYLLANELGLGGFDEITIFCTWVDNRRRDAYYKVLSRLGYDWGTYDGEKCIMKTYTIQDINPEVIDHEYK